MLTEGKLVQMKLAFEITWELEALEWVVKELIILLSDGSECGNGLKA